MQATVSSVTSSRIAVRPNVAKQIRAAPVRAVPVNVLIDIAERTGTVDAPIEYAIGAGIVVALVGTAIIPIWLKPGQEAADKIFDAQGKPLKKTTIKKGRK